MVAEHKTVSGLNRECAVTTNQSGLHQWLTEVTWEVKALNDRRVEWLQGDPNTRDSVRGVIAIDKALVDHTGKLNEDVGWFWDRANERSVIAHDDLLANDGCPSGAHDPSEWRRFQQRAACAASACKEHTPLCIELIEDAITRGIPGDFTFASSCTSAKVLNPIQDTQRAYVGAMQLNRTVVYEGRAQALQAVARQRPGQAKKPVRVGNRRYWDFSKQRRMPAITHPVRMVLCWKERDAAEARADPPRVSRQRSVQSADAFAPPEPSAGLGSDHADDHRRSLSGRQG
jgi:hypothetical protein